MSLLFRNLSNSTGGFKDALDRFVRGQDINDTADGPITTSMAAKYSAVFGCCKVLAETFASAPIFEYKKLPNGDREQTDDTGLLDVLKYRPNDEMSGFDLQEMKMNQVNTGGNLVAARLFNRSGRIVGLRPYQWENVKIDVQDNGQMIYRVRISKSEERVLTRKEVFHHKGFSFDGYIGVSPIEYATSAIRLGLQYEKFGINFYKNGALASGFFEHPGRLGDEAYSRLKSKIEDEWTGLRNAGRPILLEDGVKFNGLTMKLVDAELLASKRFQVEEICRMYRVPPHLLQDLSRSTNNNIEHQSLEFVMYTMLPLFKRDEAAINSQLLTAKQRSDGYYFEYNIAGLLRGDTKSMAEAFALGRVNGWYSVNDIRRMLNMNRIDNGDIYLQPLNMVEAGTVVQQPDNQTVDMMQNLIEQSRVK